MDGDKKENKRFVRINEAALISGLDQQTLRKLADNKKIQCYKTPSGQRRFNRSCLEAMCNTDSPVSEISKFVPINYIYARVSSKKQLDDLTRQIEYIKSGKPEYATYTLISDIGSGINFNRKGIASILDACMQRIIGELVIAHRDRLCRFGFDLIRHIVEKGGGKVTVLDDEQHKSTEQELAEDLLSIVHIYSCRQMGKRSYKRKQTEIPENQIESVEESEENCGGMDEHEQLCI